MNTNTECQQLNSTVKLNLIMTKDDEDDLLPDKDAAKGFYAKYEPKEILGR